MTVLSGAKLRERLEMKDLNKRLVVSPILDPKEQLNESQASIDVRLGCDFALMSPSAHGAIDELDHSAAARAPLKKLYRKLYVPLGARFVIHPHQFILAQALEYLRLPLDLMAYVVGRSTWGRLGLTVATAVGVHPGFAGSLTLELRNLGEAPLALRPGQAIAQLFFHGVETGVGAKVVGQYRGAVDILPKKMSSLGTRKKIESLAKNRAELSLPVISMETLKNHE